MKQICNEDYWEYMPTVRDRTEGAPCGRSFDDTDQSTLCPHDPLPAPGFIYRGGGEVSGPGVVDDVPTTGLGTDDTHGDINGGLT